MELDDQGIPNASGYYWAYPPGEREKSIVFLARHCPTHSHGDQACHCVHVGMRCFSAHDYRFLTGPVMLE